MTRLSEAQQVTDRLAAEANGARISWALFEGLNGKNDSERAAFRAGIYDLGLGGVTESLQMVLVRDTLMGLFRITDPASQNELTLCRLSRLLADEELRAERINDARTWNEDGPAQLAEANAATCEEDIKRIVNVVPLVWNEKQPPADRRLFNLRTKLKPARDATLAHALDSSRVAMPMVNDMRDFLAVVSDLVERAQRIFHGAAPSWEIAYEGRLREAAELWDIFQAGVAAARG